MPSYHLPAVFKEHCAQQLLIGLHSFSALLVFQKSYSVPKSTSTSPFRFFDIPQLCSSFSQGSSSFETRATVGFVLQRITDVDFISGTFPGISKNQNLKQLKHKELTLIPRTMSKIVRHGCMHTGKAETGRSLGFTSQPAQPTW